MHSVELCGFSKGNQEFRQQFQILDTTNSIDIDLR
jgi:hypothetical protein